MYEHLTSQHIVSSGQVMHNSELLKVIYHVYYIKENDELGTLIKIDT